MYMRTYIYHWSNEYLIAYLFRRGSAFRKNVQKIQNKEGLNVVPKRDIK